MWNTGLTVVLLLQECVLDRKKADGLAAKLMKFCVVGHARTGNSSLAIPQASASLS